MNWAKRLLNPKDDGSFTHPSHDCPRCGGRLIDEGDTVRCDTCDYPEQEDVFSVPACNCPLHDETDDGTAYCENCEYQRDGVCVYHEDDEDDDRPKCDWCGDDIPDGETWCLDTRDGTEHFCSATCRNERAADIENAPLCTWCHEKCDQGVVNSVYSPYKFMPFCSTECLVKFRTSSVTGVASHS